MSGPSIRTTQSFWPAIQHALDGGSILLSLVVVQYALHQSPHSATWTVGLGAAAIFFILGEILGCYQGLQRRSPDSEVSVTAITWLTTFGCLGLLGFMTRIADTFARSTGVAWFFVGGLALVCSRMILRATMEHFLRKGIGVRRCAIAGLNPLGLQVARNAMEHPECGLSIVGFYDDRTLDRLTRVDEDSPSYLGNLEVMIEQARRGEIDTVLVTLPMRAEQRIRDILAKLSDTSAAVYIVPDFFVFELLHSRWSDVGGLPVVSVFESPLYGVDGIVKRVLDVLIAVAGLIVLAPLFFTIGILIKWTSPGPVFFLQRRYGLDGREIKVWKFRSMSTCDNGSVVVQAVKNDPRVTPVGKILRRTSLDELPQLINVIEGNMSLVGPRPHATAHNEHFRHLIQGYMLRHKVKPGITGLAQVEGSRGETDTVDKMQKRIELDHRYIREWSLWLDLRILFRTLFVVLRQDAY